MLDDFTVELIDKVAVILLKLFPIVTVDVFVGVYKSAVSVAAGKLLNDTFLKDNITKIIT